MPTPPRRFASALRKWCRYPGLRLERMEDRLAPAAVQQINLSDPSYFGDTARGGSQLGTFNVPGPSLSADGQRVLFQSDAPNLVANDFNGTPDLFVYDRGTGAVTLVTGNYKGTAAATNGGSGGRMTPDGRYVVFSSFGSDLTPAPLLSNIYVHERVWWKDLLTGQVKQVDVDPSGADTGGYGGPDNVAISDDGTKVLFRSANGPALVPSAGAGDQLQYFLRDVAAGTTALVSRSPAGKFADRGVQQGFLSGDGKTVVFTADADNLDPRDSNTAGDLFAYDVSAQQVKLVTVTADGAAPAGGQPALSQRPVSADGRFVVYSGSPANVVPQNTSFETNAFLFDRVTQKTTLLSTNTNPTIGSNGTAPSITRNGQWVTFVSGSDAVPSDVRHVTPRRSG